MNALEIKKIRQDMGLSHTKFGEMLGVGTRTVQLWENGERNISESGKKLLLNILANEQSSGVENKDLESLQNEVALLKEKIEGMKENFKMMYQQLLFLQNSFIEMQRVNNEKKSG